MADKEIEKNREKKEEANLGLENIKKALQEEQQIRSTRCLERIRRILEEEKCIMNVESKMVEIAPGVYQVQAGMKVVSNV